MKMYPKDAKQVADCAKYRLLLRSMAEKLLVMDVYDELIAQYPQFEYWSASHNALLHHYGRGGLVRHTWEIVDLCMTVSITLNLGDTVSPVELYLAALFHDTGKMFDYELKEHETNT